MSHAPARPVANLFNLTLLGLPLLLAACSNLGSTPTVPGDASSLAQMATDGPVRVEATQGTAAGTNGSYVTLLSNGASARLTVPSGVSGSFRLQLQARGDLFQGAPVVEVRKGGVVLSKVTLSSSAASLYDAGTVTVQPGDVLEVVFVNDAWGGSFPNDRNALIDYGLFTPVDTTTTPTPSSGGYRLEAENAVNASARRGPDTSASGGQVALLLTTGAGLTWTVPASASSGTYTLTAQARQQAYQGDAQLAVRVNGGTLRTITVTGGSFQSLALGTLNLKPGDVVELVFTNDAYGGSSAADRNAYVDYFTVTPTTVPGSAPVPAPTPTPAPAASGAFTLSNRNASADAKKLYAWIGNLKNRTQGRLLSGQNAIFNNGYNVEANWQYFMEGLAAQAGKYPAMTEAGLIDNYDEVTNKLTGWWRSGGLVVVNAHWRNPWRAVPGSGAKDDAWLWPSEYQNTATNKRKPDLSSVLRSAPASAQKTDYWNQVGLTGAALQKLRDNGVVVIFRPLHEANYLHFWWGADNFSDNSAGYKALWRDLHSHYTDTLGLNNLIWMYGPGKDFGNDNSLTDYSYPPMVQYPGDDVVDMLGVDIYDDCYCLDRPADYTEMRAKNKPMYIHEGGPAGGQNDPRSWDTRTIINRIRQDMPENIGWMSWHSWDGSPIALRDQLAFKELLSDPWVITRDELDWR